MKPQKYIIQFFSVLVFVCVFSIAPVFAEPSDIELPLAETPSLAAVAQEEPVYLAPYIRYAYNVSTEKTYKVSRFLADLQIVISFLVTVNAVDDEGDGAVAGDVAGGAEAVHGDVEGDHEGVVGVAEAEHSREDAERGHDCSAGDAGGGDDRYAEHGDETGKHRGVVGHAVGDYDCHGAGDNLHGRA